MDPVFVCLSFSGFCFVCFFSATATVAVAAVRSEEERVCLAFPIH